MGSCGSSLHSRLTIVSRTLPTSSPHPWQDLKCSSSTWPRVRWPLRSQISNESHSNVCLHHNLQSFTLSGFVRKPLEDRFSCRRETKTKESSLDLLRLPPFSLGRHLSVVTFLCRWNRSQTRTKILGRFVTKRGPFRALAFNKNKNKPCKLYWFPLSTSKHRARWSYSDAFWMWLAFYKSTVHPNDETSGLPIIYPAVFEPLMCLSQLPTQLSSRRVVSRIVFIIMLVWSWLVGFYLSHHLHGYIRSYLLFGTCLIT